VPRHAASKRLNLASIEIEEGKMTGYIAAVVSVLFLGGVQAQESGTKITGDELSALVTGAKVTHYSKAGSVRRWTNEPDGSLVASSDAKQFASAAGYATTGRGKWSLSGDGKYCIEIDWKRVDEKWCASIVKAADGGYYLGSVDPSRKIEFSK
jgi:hypothetical protein